MSLKNTKLGGIDWNTPSARIKPTDLNDTFNATILQLVPIGAIFPWLKDYTNTPNLPEAWVECNGQTLSDGESVYDGQTIPDLNGNNRFLRGNSTSGGTGGESEHTLTENEMPIHNHSVSMNNYGAVTYSSDDEAVSNDAGSHYTTPTGNTGGDATHENKPPYYEVVFIIRIK